MAGKAIGLTRPGIAGSENIDLYALAERHGFALVFTLYLDVGPTLAVRIVAQHLYEHDAEVLVVPAFEHADGIVQPLSGRAGVITPNEVYPSCHRWHDAGHLGGGQ